MPVGSLLKIFPRIKCCCFCTRNLGLACGLIAIWSMFVSVHEIRMLIVPACEDQYDACDDGLDVILFTLKLILIPINVIAWICSFFFLVTVYMMAWIFIIVMYVFSGLIVSILSLTFAVILIVHLNCTKCKFDLNDGIFLILYSILWIYYMFIISTYGLSIDEKYRDEKKGNFMPIMYKENSEIAAKYAAMFKKPKVEDISVSAEDLSAKSKSKKKFINRFKKAKNPPTSNSDANSDNAKAKKKKPWKKTGNKETDAPKAKDAPKSDIKPSESKIQTQKKKEKKSKKGKNPPKDGADNSEASGKKGIQDDSPKLDSKPSVNKKEKMKKNPKKVKNTKV